MQWDEEQQDRRLLRWYRRLIQLRLASDSLTDGDFHTVLADDAANVYAFSRTVPDEQTLVVLHAGTAHWRGQLPIPDWAREFAAWTLCCQTGGMTEDDPFHPTILTDDPGRFEAELPARSVKIIRFINKKIKGEGAIMKQTSIKKMLALFLIAAVMLAAFTACAEKAPDTAQSQQPASDAAVPPMTRRQKRPQPRPKNPLRSTSGITTARSPQRMRL